MNDMQRQQRREAMLQRMSQHKSQGGGTDYWKPEEGKNIIRILPEVGNMDMFFQVVGRHNVVVGKEEKSILCPNTTTDGDLECPLCQWQKQLYKAGEKEDASNIRVKDTFQMNILVREVDKDGRVTGTVMDSDGTPKVYVFTPGIKIFESLTGIVADPDFGDITDLEAGRDISIDRKGKTLNDTKYEVRPRGKSSPACDDPETMEAVLGKARDLSEIEGKLPTYEEIVDEVGLGDVLDGAETAPKAKRTRQASDEEF
jgi:hypothetical protein